MSLSSTTEPAGLRPFPLRRKVAAVCLVLTPFAMMTEMASWPVGSDGSTAAQLQAAATSPTAYTVAWMAESTTAVLSVVGVLGLLGYLRNRGRTLALIGAVMSVGGQVGILTGGGFNAAIVPLAQQPERAVAVQVLDRFNGQPVLTFLGTLVWLGLVGTVLLVVAAIRGGLVRWWAVVLVAVAIVSVPLLDSDLYGLEAAATALPLVVVEIWLGVALFRTRLVESPTASPARSVAHEPVEAAAVS